MRTCRPVAIVDGILGTLAVTAILSGIGVWAQTNQNTNEIKAVEKHSAERKEHIDKALATEMAHIREIQDKAEKQNTKEHVTINKKLENIDSKLDVLIAK